MFAPPAVAGELVFVGSCSGTFYALDVATGQPRWSHDIRRDGKQTSFHGAILIERDQVLFGTDHGCAPGGIGHVYAAERPTGRIVWKYRSPVGVASNLVRIRTAVCFGTMTGEWGCVGAKDGALRWKTAPAPAAACDFPRWAATDGRVLVVSTSDGALAALRPSDGKVVWRRTLVATATTSPVVSGGVVYIGAADDKIHAVESASGRVLRSMPLPARPVGRPTVDGGTLYVMLEDRRGGGRVVALDRATGRVKWSHEQSRTFASEEPHVWRDVVVVADCSGSVTALATADGAPRWSLRVAGCIRSVSSSERLLFVGAQEGTVYAVRAPVSVAMKLP